MSRVRSYRELRVYRQAFRQAMVIREVVASFPAEERYDLAPQLRRSSRSVCANLAEAWRRRYYPRAFAAKLIDAEAEASETRVHLEIAAACGYLTDAQFNELDDAYDHILAQLVVMRTHPEDWKPGGAEGRIGHGGGDSHGGSESKGAGGQTGHRGAGRRGGSRSTGADGQTERRSGHPTATPRSSPTDARTKNRSGSPTGAPRSSPTGAGTKNMGGGPTDTPRSSPTDARTKRRSGRPTDTPRSSPTSARTKNRSGRPTDAPHP